LASSGGAELCAITATFIVFNSNIQPVVCSLLRCLQEVSTQSKSVGLPTPHILWELLPFPGAAVSGWESQHEHSSSAFLSQVHFTGDGAEKWKGVERNLQRKLA